MTTSTQIFPGAAEAQSPGEKAELRADLLRLNPEGRCFGANGMLGWSTSSCHFLSSASPSRPFTGASWKLAAWRQDIKLHRKSYFLLFLSLLGNRDTTWFEDLESSWCDSTTIRHVIFSGFDLLNFVLFTVLYWLTQSLSVNYTYTDQLKHYDLPNSVLDTLLLPK